MILAAIDIGTNTLRLLVADCRDGNWTEIYSDRQMTRLGEGFQISRKLTAGAMERTAAALRSFYSSIKQYSCEDVMAVATSAVREARNQDEFLTRMRKEVPFEIRVISGEEEARLAWLGIRQAVSSPTELQILFDIGGGSTEWILADREKIIKKTSLPLGVVFLTERFLISDPPSRPELAEMNRFIRRYLPEVRNEFGEDLRKPGEITWIGTAGTLTTLAAIDQGLAKYAFDKVNGYRLSRDRAAGIYRRLLSGTKAERGKIKGLEAGREDIIVAGTAILLESMSYFQFDELVVSDYGLREGILIDRMGRPDLTK